MQIFELVTKKKKNYWQKYTFWIFLLYKIQHNIINFSFFICIKINEEVLHIQFLEILVQAQVNNEKLLFKFLQSHFVFELLV